LFLEGHALFISRLNVGRSIELLEKAVELDPQFARAWEELGAAYSVAEGWGVKGDNFYAKSEAAARKALELNPGLSIAWAVLGEVAADGGDLIAAVDSYDRAIENDPLNPTAWFWRGLRYALIGFLDQAVSDIEQCIRLDPAYYNCYRHISAMYAALGRNEDAFSAYRFALKHGVNVNDFWIVPLYLRTGNEDAAAFALLAEARGIRSYPFKEFWEALANPGPEYSEGIRGLELWSEENGSPLAFRHLEWIILGDYERVKPGLDSYRLWLQDYQAFRASPYFHPLLIELGVTDYWRAKGFPPMCRPLGEDDFECD
jgi:tetratricopeptide (TPR) repeat protein